KSFDFGIRHGFLTRLNGYGDRDRFLAGVDAFALIDVEDDDVAHQLLVHILRGAHDVGGFHRNVDNESEIALDGLEGRQLKPGVCARGPCFRFRDLLENDFESDQRALGLEASDRTRMQFPEVSQYVLRTDLDCAAASGMKPGRAAGHDLQGLYRGSGSSQHGESVGFCVKSIDGSSLIRPVTTASRRLGKAPAHPPRSAAVGWQ